MMESKTRSRIIGSISSPSIHSNFAFTANAWTSSFQISGLTVGYGVQRAYTAIVRLVGTVDDGTPQAFDVTFSGPTRGIDIQVPDLYFYYDSGNQRMRFALAGGSLSRATWGVTSDWIALSSPLTSPITTLTFTAAQVEYSPLVTPVIFPDVEALINYGSGTANYMYLIPSIPNSGLDPSGKGIDMASESIEYWLTVSFDITLSFLDAVSSLIESKRYSGVLSAFCGDAAIYNGGFAVVLEVNDGNELRIHLLDLNGPSTLVGIVLEDQVSSEVVNNAAFISTEDHGTIAQIGYVR